MGALKPVDLSVVAKRLEEYDKLDVLWHENALTMSGKQQLAGLAQLDEAKLRVKEAFADATADRNSRENAMLINFGGKNNPGGLCTLRTWLKGDGLYH